MNSVVSKLVLCALSASTAVLVTKVTTDKPTKLVLYNKEGVVTMTLDGQDGNLTLYDHTGKHVRVILGYSGWGVTGLLINGEANRPPNVKSQSYFTAGLWASGEGGTLTLGANPVKVKSSQGTMLEMQTGWSLGTRNVAPDDNLRLTFGNDRRIVRTYYPPSRTKK